MSLLIAVLQSITEALDEGMPIARIVTHILHTIVRRAAERGIDLEYDKHFQPQDIYDLFTPEGAYEYLKTAARNISTLISGARANAEAMLAKRAEDYIKGHYYESPSASKLAVTLGATPEYFERVFEEHQDMGVSEYAARLRIHEAKSLIRKTSLDDEMVAIKVGYDDVRQFRNEFKEYEHMSVKEFRTGLGW